MFEFTVIAKDKKSAARTGEFITPHGKLQTPELAFVATEGEIRSIPKKLITKLPVKLTISNTFHLLIKKLIPEIQKSGGLNCYMNFSGVTMTDSGGFQVFSLGFGKSHGVGKVANIFPEENKKLNTNITQDDKNNPLKITEEGVDFNFDGKKLTLTPELSIQLQRQIGADIIFAFDECTSPLNSYEYTKQAMERTHRWLKRCIKEDQRSKIKDQSSLKLHKIKQSDFKTSKNQNYKKTGGEILGFRQRAEFFQPVADSSTGGKKIETGLVCQPPQALFAIIQGGAFEDLRKTSVKFMAGQDVSGFGVGGSLGKTKQEMYQVLEWTIPFLPDEKPRHLLGIGQVRDIFEAVERGVDLFDCVIPTREARHQILYTLKGKINVRKSKTVEEIVDQNCHCLMCREKITFSKLYQLYKLDKLKAFFYATLHNIQFFSDLMKEIREAIEKNLFFQLKKRFLQYY